jgi:hypothetical protein
MTDSKEAGESPPKAILISEFSTELLKRCHAFMAVDGEKSKRSK